MSQFLRKVSREGECWLWTGARYEHGYGKINQIGRENLAHRYAYRLFVGPIDDGLHVCHSCDNPLCVNPEHLWLGTHQDNMTDRDRKRRRSTKLSPELATSIRSMYASGRYLQRELAELFGVSTSTVCTVIRGGSWTAS